MTTKTSRTLALIDSLAPPLCQGRPCLVVPALAWCFYSEHYPTDLRGWWDTRRTKYDGGLMFKLRD